VENENLPLVSIGVPVFNGESKLSLALDSLLDQDYPNLEIVISDNASTDSTQDICQKYALKNSCIKYSRSEKNLGVVWNFNRVFELATGKYFVWAAYDDQREKSFVSACVEGLEKDPEAVLCQSHVEIFAEGRENILCATHLDSFEGVVGLVERYRETLIHVPAVAIYGLMRSSAMRKTRMFRKTMGTDLAFIQDLSLYGNFIQVPKVLFNYSGRQKWNTVHQDYYAFTGKKKKPWWYLPFVVVFCDHWGRVACSPFSFKSKLRLWSILIGYEIRRLTLRAVIKVLGRLCPEKWKERLGTAIYWRWLHSPNIKPGSAEYFLDRVIKPTLGWWR
jgi:glycosyltransferase involved in cell wall biosynthesis